MGPQGSDLDGVRQSVELGVIKVVFSAKCHQCYTPEIPARREERQENLNFEANVGYIARSCLKSQHD